MILRIGSWQIDVSGVNKPSNMDEGNEVLVCASEYLKGMLILKTKNYRTVCVWFCSLVP